MRYIFILAGVVALVGAILLFLGNTGTAAIVGSSHDLRTYGTGGPQATTQVCVYCHTPHNANTDARLNPTYLWNRNIRATDYTVYDATYTDPLTNNTPHTLMCMSCHDGATTAIGQMLNPPNDYSGAQDTVYVTGDADLDTGGEELTNDHPVDLIYLTVSEGGVLPDDDFFTSTSIETAGIELFTFGTNSNVMTCASCHEPHNKTGLDSFLRVTPDNSQICTTCHNM